MVVCVILDITNILCHSPAFHKMWTLIEKKMLHRKDSFSVYHSIDFHYNNIIINIHLLLIIILYYVKIVSDT